MKRYNENDNGFKKILKDLIIIAGIPTSLIIGHDYVHSVYCTEYIKYANLLKEREHYNEFIKKAMEHKDSTIFIKHLSDVDLNELLIED